MEETLFENQLKVGDKVIYNGLGVDIEGVIIKRGKPTSQIASITIKLQFSTVKMKFCKNCTASDIGLRIAN